MDVKTVRLLANYTAGANKEMNAILATLSTEEWDRDMKGFFQSIHSLCSHIYVADVNWLIRFKAYRSFTSLSDPLLERPLPWEKTPFASIDEYRKKREALDAVYIGFSKELTDSDMEKDLTYTDSRGTPTTRNLGSSILHAFNHGTHHRGMIALYLDILGKKNDFNSLIEYA